MAILEVNNINKKFGSNEVLKGISFSLEQGEVLSIIGSSGSGKTTLLRCLNFLEIPETGSITVDGDVVFDASLNVDEKGRPVKVKSVPRQNRNSSLLPAFT